MSEKSITWRKLDDLHLWDMNPNQGDVGSILQSVNRFGYNESIIVWRDRVQGGNHRVMALHQLWQGGWRPGEKDRAVRVNGDGLEVATWDVSHIETEQEANAFGIALNRTTRLGMDDPAKLAALLQDIKAVDESAFVASGFDAEDLDNILKGYTPDFEPQTSAKIYGQGDIDRVSDELESKFNKTLEKEVEILCPECGMSSFVRVSDLLKDKNHV